MSVHPSRPDEQLDAELSFMARLRLETERLQAPLSQTDAADQVAPETLRVLGERLVALVREGWAQLPEARYPGREAALGWRVAKFPRLHLIVRPDGGVWWVDRAALAELESKGDRWALSAALAVALLALGITGFGLDLAAASGLGVLGGAGAGVFASVRRRRGRLSETVVGEWEEGRFELCSGTVAAVLSKEVLAAVARMDEAERLRRAQLEAREAPRRERAVLVDEALRRISTLDDAPH